MSSEKGSGFGAHRRGGGAAPPAVDPELLRAETAAAAAAAKTLSSADVKVEENDQPRRRREIVTKPEPMLAELKIETKGGVEIDKVTRKPVIRFEEQKDPWVEDELKKWEEERARVKEQRHKLESAHAVTPPGDAAAAAVAQLKLTTPTNDPAQQEKNRAAFLEKRRTIGVATPHSHFFAELEAARKAKKDLEAQAASNAQTPAAAGPPKPSASVLAAAATAAAGPRPVPADYNPGADPSRPCQEVSFPACRPLMEDDLFDKTGKVNVALLKEHLMKEGRLDFNCAKRLITAAAELLKAEPNCLEIQAPCLVFGDLHGQYYDLVNLVEKSGNPEKTRYLFLGDYVDRGMFGCECVFYLFGLKVNYPQNVFLLRGNHESRLLAEHFNFKQECMWKYNEDIYNAIQDAFDCLPLAATLEANFGKFFCVHGGLSPEVTTVKEINELNRFREPPEKGPFCDMLWSDPIEEQSAIGLTALQLTRWHAKTFEPNPTRGCSYFYGYGAVRDFLTKNNFLCVVRAHEVQKQGYKLHKFKKFDLKQAPVITVFSAPNYCDMYENWAAWLIVDRDNYTFGQVAWVDHPYYLPNFSNAIAFTFPFVVENCTLLRQRRFFLIPPVMKILADVMTAIGEIGFEQQQQQTEYMDDAQLMEELAQKRVRAMGRIAIMMKKMRLEREANIKRLEAKKDEKYDLALSMDLKNEKRPIDIRKRHKTF